jgi:hypothetical protein
MIRNGKIALLPHSIREQINHGLHDARPAAEILDWLNALPEVRSVLDAQFCGQPVSEMNLSRWRNGGFQEWLARQDLLPEAGELVAIHEEIRSATRGGSLADHLSTAVSFRLAAILGASGLELDEKALAQLRALLPLSQTIVKMRQGEFAAARLRIKNSAT